MSKNQKKAKSDDFIILANNFELKDKTKTQKVNFIIKILLLTVYKTLLFQKDKWTSSYNR